MGWKQRYKRRKTWLATEPTICQENQRLFKRFLRWEERKLRRTNGLRSLDEACFKTLYGYLPRTKLKRSRLSRGEPTLYTRTVELLDEVLDQRRAKQRLFHFSYRKALDLIAVASRISGATTMPNHQPIRWKDLRSGMACHLLANGWTCDEVNARLGHAPNSNALNSYINFLALSRDDPKHRMHIARRHTATECGAQREALERVAVCPHCKAPLPDLLLAA